MKWWCGKSYASTSRLGTAVVWEKGTGLWEGAACSAGEARRTTGNPAVRQRDIRLYWVCCGENILKDMLNSHILHRPVRNPASPVPLAVDYLHYHTYQNFRSEKESMVWKSQQNSDNWACIMSLPAVKQAGLRKPSNNFRNNSNNTDSKGSQKLFSLFRQVNLRLHCVAFMLCD